MSKNIYASFPIFFHEKKTKKHTRQKGMDSNIHKHLNMFTNGCVEAFHIRTSGINLKNASLIPAPGSFGLTHSNQTELE